MACIEHLIGVLPSVRVRVPRSKCRMSDKGGESAQLSITSTDSFLPVHTSRSNTPNSQSISLAGGVAVFFGNFLVATTASFPVLSFYSLHANEYR